MLFQLVLVLRTFPSCWCEVQLAQASTCPMIYAAAPPIMSTNLRVSSQVNGLKLLFLCVHVVLDERGVGVGFSWLSPCVVWLPYVSCSTTISERSDRG